METGKLEAEKKYPRCFVGIPLPDKLQKEFSDLRRELGDVESRLRLVDAESAHVLLVFLDKQDKETLAAAAKEIRPLVGPLAGINLSVGGYGDFQSRRVKVAFLRVKGLEGKDNLVGLLREKLRRFNRDDKPFRPHVTVARLAGDSVVPEGIKERLNRVRWEFPVTEVAIYGAGEKLIVMPINND